MIWPSGGAASTLQLICNQLPSCGRLVSSAEIPYCVLSSDQAGDSPRQLSVFPSDQAGDSPRQLSVFQRFCAGRVRGEPSAMLPGAHAQRHRSSYIPVPVPLTLFVFSLFRLTRVAAGLQQATPCRSLAPVRLQRGHDFQSLSGSHCRQIAHRAYHSPQSHFGLVYVLVDAHQRAQIGGDIGLLVVVHL